MIKSKQELREYLLEDAKANRRKKLSASFIGDEIWKFIRTMRYLDYYSYKKAKSFIYLPLYCVCKYRYHKLCLKLGFCFPYDVADKGLSIAHYGSIVVNSKAVIGENCRIHTCVLIGASSGNPNAPKIGKNVYIGTGAKILGDIVIADDVCIGAGAVVVKSITEPGTTWGGIPAKKISDNDSHACLSPLLFE